MLGERASGPFPLFYGTYTKYLTYGKYVCILFGVHDGGNHRKEGQRMIPIGEMSMPEAKALSDAWPAATRSMLALQFLMDGNEEKQVAVFIVPPKATRKPRVKKKA